MSKSKVKYEESFMSALGNYPITEIYGQPRITIKNSIPATTMSSGDGYNMVAWQPSSTPPDNHVAFDGSNSYIDLGVGFTEQALQEFAFRVKFWPTKGQSEDKTWEIVLDNSHEYLRSWVLQRLGNAHETFHFALGVKDQQGQISQISLPFRILAGKENEVFVLVTREIVSLMNLSNNRDCRIARRDGDIIYPTSLDKHLFVGKWYNSGTGGTRFFKGRIYDLWFWRINSSKNEKMKELNKNFKATAKTIGAIVDINTKKFH